MWCMRCGATWDNANIMRQLLGVVLSNMPYRDDDLKRHLMFFDKIHAVMKALPVPRGHEDEFPNSMDFLHSHNILLETATCPRRPETRRSQVAD